MPRNSKGVPANFGTVKSVPQKKFENHCSNSFILIVSERDGTKKVFKFEQTSGIRLTNVYAWFMFIYFLFINLYGNLKSIGDGWFKWETYYGV